MNSLYSSMSMNWLNPMSMGFGSSSFGLSSLSGLGGMNSVFCYGGYDPALMGWNIASSLLEVGGGVTCKAIQASKTAKAEKQAAQAQRDTDSDTVNSNDNKIAKYKKQFNNPSEYVDKSIKNAVSKAQKAVDDNAEKIKKLNGVETDEGSVAYYQKKLDEANKKAPRVESEVTTAKTLLEGAIKEREEAQNTQEGLKEKLEEAKEALSEAEKNIKEEAEKQIAALQKENKEKNQNIEHSYYESLPVSRKCDSIDELKEIEQMEVTEKTAKKHKQAFNYLYSLYHKTDKDSEKKDYAQRAVAIYDQMNSNCSSKLDATMDGAYRNLKSYLAKQ